MEELDRVAPKLNGIKRDTFVFKTITERWPSIIGKIVDHFHRKRRDLMAIYGGEADQEVKDIIHALAEMRYRLQTDKPLQRVTDDYPDAIMWNSMLDMYAQIQNDPNLVTWFKIDWLFVECYLYRMMFGAVFKTRHLKHYDYFSESKNLELDAHLKQILESIKFFWDTLEPKEGGLDVRTTLITIIKMCLWGNRCDLSLTGGEQGFQATSIAEAEQKRDKYILVNDIERAVDDHLLKMNGTRRVDIVLDNAGFELIGDLIFADFLISHNLANKILFHIKPFPWFVSDVVQSDIEFTLGKLMSMEDPGAKRAGLTWRERFQKGQFEFVAEPFWNYPHAYHEMKRVHPALYAHLAEASFIVFKGDLNYRKLVDDREWSYVTPFAEAARGFCPAPFLALRTLKAETVVGLSADSAAEMAEHYGANTHWLVTGEYAVAQLHQ